MPVGDNQHGAMTLYAHWLVVCSVKHNAAVKAALAIDPGTLSGSGRSAAEFELTGLNVAFYEQLHSLSTIAGEVGPGEIFRPRSLPLTPEERLLVQR